MTESETHRRACVLLREDEASPDSLAKQRALVEAYAAEAGIKIVAEHIDNSRDGIDQRRGLAALLVQLETDPGLLVLAGNDRPFSDDSILAELILELFERRHINVLTVDSETNLLETTSPLRSLIRHVLGTSKSLDLAMTRLKNDVYASKRRPDDQLEEPMW